MQEDKHTQNHPTKVVKPFINATIVPQIPNSKISARYDFDAGWSSPVARQAHNLKVTGSNPVPAPKDPFH